MRWRVLPAYCEDEDEQPPGIARALLSSTKPRARSSSTPQASPQIALNERTLSNRSEFIPKRSLSHRFVSLGGVNVSVWCRGPRKVRSRHQLLSNRIQYRKSATIALHPQHRHWKEPD